MVRTNTVLVLAGLVALGAAGGCGNSKKGGGTGGSNSTTGSGGENSGGTGGEGTGGEGTGGGASGGSSSGGSGGTGGGTGGDGSGGQAATGGGGGTGGSDGTGGTGGGAGAPPDLTDLVVVVTPADDQADISPHVYGVAGEDAATATGATVVRSRELRSNVISGYNWEINATHLGDQGGFENGAFGSGSTEGAAATALLSVAEANEGAAMLFVPVGDIVAADATATDVTQSADYLTTRFVANVAAKGAAFESPPNTADEFVYQDEFVNWVMNEAGSTPVVFTLDHHPSLWDLEQSVIHSSKATYDEVVGLNVEFASAIKDVWSDTEVAGPALYGWEAYVDLQDSPDHGTEGNFLLYYLTQMAAADTDQGRRLLDYLDVHWSPDIYVDGIRINGEDNGLEVADARMQAPRSLWNSGYVEDSWITNSLNGGSVNLIGRMHTAIDDTYPGTKLALSSWYYGGGSHVSGAIAAADVLGVLGREGVDLAVAALPETAPFARAAFTAFLDYDGGGSRFGDTSVSATTDDALGSSAYASISSGSEEDVVIVLINKRRNARDASIQVDSDTEYATCLVYELTSDAAALVSADPLSGDANVFEYQMPALSVAVLVPQQ